MNGKKLLAGLCALAAMLCLCACRYEAKAVGTWQGSGRIDVLCLDDPVTELVFSEDGTLVIQTEKGGTEYGYSMSDDTLTINGDGISYGVRYSIKRDELRIRSGGGTEAVFARVD